MYQYAATFLVMLISAIIMLVLDLVYTHAFNSAAEVIPYDELLSPPEPPKAPLESSNGSAYPDSSLYQFTQKEADDAFLRMANNIRQETEKDLTEQDKFIAACNEKRPYSYITDGYSYITDGNTLTVKHLGESTKAGMADTYSTLETDRTGKVYFRTRYADDVVDTDSLYVWGQEEPIATFQHGHIIP